jgi:hypothetical protein
MNPDFGGYSCEMFVDTIPEVLKCGTCLGVLKDPLQCKNGHSHCHTCALNFLRVSKQCPICKVTVSKTRLMCKNLVVRNLIDGLKVFCDQCDWIGPLSQFENHKTDHTNQMVAGEDEDEVETLLDDTDDEVMDASQQIIKSRHSTRVTKTYVGQVKEIHTRDGKVSRKKHGTGVEFFGKNLSFSGEFENGFRCGHGSITCETNKKTIFQGIWLKGKKHGLGTTYHTDGGVTHQVWKKGRKCFNI